MAVIEAYPLQWPAGQKRTDSWRRERGPFKTSLASARDGILRELKLMGVNRQVIVISTNIRLRADGLPYGDGPKRPLNDPGVAVYFTRKQRPLAFACDNYQSVEQNLRAVQMTLQAMRGIERWGAREMLDKAFVGFTALPAPAKPKHWREVLNISGPTNLASVKATRDQLARHYHPDTGGTHEKMVELNRAYEEALREVTS